VTQSPHEKNRMTQSLHEKMRSASKRFFSCIQRLGTSASCD
jgi:hypothetical protein